MFKKNNNNNFAQKFQMHNILFFLIMFPEDCDFDHGIGGKISIDI